MALPVQVIDPEVHRLIEEGPADGGGGSTGVCSTWNLASWRTGSAITRALKQRNAALKAGRGPGALGSGELVRLGEAD